MFRALQAQGWGGLWHRATQPHRASMACRPNVEIRGGAGEVGSCLLSPASTSPAASGRPQEERRRMSLCFAWMVVCVLANGGSLRPPGRREGPSGAHVVLTQAQVGDQGWRCVRWGVVQWHQHTELPAPCGILGSPAGPQLLGAIPLRSRGHRGPCYCCESPFSVPAIMVTM